MDPTFALQAKTASKIVVRHREMIAAISAGQSYTADVPLVVKFGINPGLDGTCPWLSQVANAYEKYRALNVKMEFVPGQPVTAASTVMMLPEYDVTDPPPINLIDASANQDVVQGQAFSKIVCNFTGLDSKRLFNTRQTLETNGTDIHEFDCANAYFMYAGSASFVGYVYISYSFELSIPQLDNNTTAVVARTPNGTLSAVGGYGTSLVSALPAFVSQTTIGGTHTNVTLHPKSIAALTDVLVTAVDGCTVSAGTPVGGATNIYNIMPTGTGNMTFDLANAATSGAIGFYDLTRLSWA
jgi:hypothetical protein